MEEITERTRDVENVCHVIARREETPQIAQLCGTCLFLGPALQSVSQKHPRSLVSYFANSVLKMATTISIASPADFHVHLRQGEMSALVTPHVRKGGFNLAYVMVHPTYSALASLKL